MLSDSKQWICVVIIIVILVSECSGNSQCKISCSSPNVRTVLYRYTDMRKECWSRDEIALLLTRRVMQELLPKKQPADVSLLLKYIKECLNTVKTLAPSKRSHSLIITALSDTLGGYLQAFALPIARQAFYEGRICSSTVQQLYELQSAIKSQLRTDGGGWTNPITVRPKERLSPLNLSRVPFSSDFCSSLLKNEDLFPQSDKTRVDFFLPFLDDNSSPTAVALPYKDKLICSLKSFNCTNILIKYYTRSLLCLKQTYGTDLETGDGGTEFHERPLPQVCEVQKFLSSFYKWLILNVVPRLKDDHLYPVFGSVLKIVHHLESEIIKKPTNSRYILGKHHKIVCKSNLKDDQYFNRSKKSWHKHRVGNLERTCSRNYPTESIDVIWGLSKKNYGSVRKQLDKLSL